jgi:hypothetical protein
MGRGLVGGAEQQADRQGSVEGVPPLLEERFEQLPLHVVFVGIGHRMLCPRLDISMEKRNRRDARLCR